MASIDKRSRKSWRARVRIPGHEDKTRSFNTRAEAQEWARITEAQLRSGVDTIPDAAAEPTLAQALDWYLEQETPKKKGKAGRPVSGILDKISQLCRDVKTKSRRYRCLGSKGGKNCKKSWAYPRNRLRILKHACHCPHLPANLRAEANNLRSDESPGAILEKLETSAWERTVASTQETNAHGTKRPRLDSSTMDNISNAQPPPLDILVGETGRKHLQAQLNLAIINLICAACLPPTLVDYAEWKKLFTIANTRYHPMSSTTLVDDHIPGQAARVRKMTIEYLKTQFDLTVSYDGATTK